MIHRDVLTGGAGKRIAQALLRLRAAPSASIATNTLGDCLLLASWNIRDFVARARATFSISATRSGVTAALLPH